MSPLRILVRTPLNSHTGYGNDGIGICRTLNLLGHTVFLDPLFVSAPLPRDVTDLLTRRVEPPFDVLIHHQEPRYLGISDDTRKVATTTVAWTMWEFDSLDNMKGRSTLKTNLRNFDAVVGYDAVTTGALAPYLPKSATPLTVQGGFEPQKWRAAQRDWTGERFSFCMVGALHQRKDPFVAVRAFKELKEELPEEFAPAELHLKTVTPGLHSAMQGWVPKLYVHYESWPDETLHSFYASQHVLLAPSRGEGKNLPALEMLATGGTVIATNWGGHTQWMSREIAYPLDYTLVPEAPDLPNCRSARADKDHLKELMLHTFRNRNEAARKGALAARLIPQSCSWEAVLDRLFTKLAREVPSAQQLSHDHRMTVHQHMAEVLGV